MIVCNVCKLSKATTEYNKHAGRANGFQARCRPCDSEISSRAYRKNPQRIRDNNNKALARNRAFVSEYLQSHPCVDCGNDDLRVLEFDHVRGVKKNDMSRLVTSAVSIKTLETEIDKCEVRCANCHRIVTFERRKAAKLAALIGN